MLSSFLIIIKDWLRGQMTICWLLKILKPVDFSGTRAASGRKCLLLLKLPLENLASNNGKQSVSCVITTNAVLSSCKY